LPKIKVTKQKGSTNKACFTPGMAARTSLQPSHKPKPATLLLHHPPYSFFVYIFMAVKYFFELKIKQKFHASWPEKTAGNAWPRG
jgi:hypothetical protein